MDARKALADMYAELNDSDRWHKHVAVISNALSQTALSQPTAPVAVVSEEYMNISTWAEDSITEGQTLNIRQPAPPADVSEDERVVPQPYIVDDYQPGDRVPAVPDPDIEHMEAEIKMLRKMVVPQDVLVKVGKSLARIEHAIYEHGLNDFNRPWRKLAVETIALLQPFLKGGE